MNQFEMTQKTIANLFLQAEGYDREFLLRFLMKKMGQRDRQELMDVMSGKSLPSLSADIIAKKIFDLMSIRNDCRKCFGSLLGTMELL